MGSGNFQQLAVFNSFEHSVCLPYSGNICRVPIFLIVLVNHKNLVPMNCSYQEYNCAYVHVVCMCITKDITTKHISDGSEICNLVCYMTSELLLCEYPNCHIIIIYYYYVLYALALKLNVLVCLRCIKLM